MKRSNESALVIKDDGLEFPDWSGMDDSTNRMSVAAAFQLCQDYLSWFPEAARKSWLERRDHPRVEFSL